MVTETRHSGTLRTDYEADRARLDDLRPLTADTDILLHRLTKASREMPYRDADGREGTLTPLLENHVLTVLADIRRKKLSGYRGTFAEAQGTAEQARYARKLEENVEGWVRRLEAYLNASLPTTGTDSASAEVAYELLDLLKNALQGTAGEDNRRYYRMLRTVTTRQENADRYWQRASESGDTEPAIALLLAHLKNYAGISEAFNRRFASLPELYRREVLHVAPRKAVPDNAYLIVTPARKGVTLAQDTAFTAGDDLTYKITEKEYISPIRCVGAQAVHKDNDGLHIQKLNIEDTSTAETLFTGGEELRTGWQIESPMLVLEEGRREVEIRFILDKGQADNGMKSGFTVEYATAEGWTDTQTKCKLTDSGLTFCFTIERDAPSPTSCTKDLHGTVTEYPALRILTTNQDYPTWADGQTFREVRIAVNVSGIRNFTFLNELGEVDTTQPFSPFGIQAERGAWFIFGNEETGMKPLKEVKLTGTWQKLPETKSLFNDIYMNYPKRMDVADFRIRTEWQKGGKWHPCAESCQLLFGFDEQGRFKQACFVFSFVSENAVTFLADNDSYEYARNKDVFFRTTLDSPDTGFGMTAYRNRFTEVMVHNSRCKEKEMWKLPQEPPIPLLADVEMAYKAEDKLTVPQSTSTAPSSSAGKIKIIPIALAADYEVPPREGLGRLLPLYPTSNLFYLAFADAKGEQKVRIYMDMALPKDKLPYYHPDPEQPMELSWQYWDGKQWVHISSKQILAEETSGLTQGGFVEICFDEKIPAEWLDDGRRLWLRAALTTGVVKSGEGHDTKWQDADTSSCLALRGVWTNCIKVTADGGDGTSLPAGTIQRTVEEDGRIGNIKQPLPGFGGTPAMTKAQAASHQTARFANRHRAVTQHGYEQILLEHFPEVDYARCFTLPKGKDRKKPSVCLVVFSRAEDSRYFLSQPWKLKEMERTLKRYAPACADLQVVNPLYEKIEVQCRSILHFKVQDVDKVKANLISITKAYFMPWRKDSGIPIPGQAFSYKELHSRLVNHEDLQRVVSLTIDGKEYPANGDDKDYIIQGKKPWSILVPEVEIELLAPDDGVGGNGIGNDFVIG